MNESVISMYQNLSLDVDWQKQFKFCELKLLLLFNGSLNTHAVDNHCGTALLYFLTLLFAFEFLSLSPIIGILTENFLYWYQEFLCSVEPLYFSDEKSTTVEKWLTLIPWLPCYITFISHKNDVIIIVKLLSRATSRRRVALWSLTIIMTSFLWLMNVI